MEDRKYYIDLIEHYVWGYNSCWDLCPDKSELRTNTEEAVEKISSYCTIIKNNKKRIESNYEDNPDDIKLIVQEIYKICNDDVDRRSPVYRGERSISHIDENNHISIERDIYSVCNAVLNYCDDLKEIIKSEKDTVDFNKFLGKFIDFVGYEYGSYTVYFDKISKDKHGEYTYDGIEVLFGTPDSEIGANGITVENVEDCPLSHLPYCPDKYDSDNDNYKQHLYNWLESCEETTLEELQKSINNYASQLLDYCNPSILYYMNRHPKNS